MDVQVYRGYWMLNWFNKEFGMTRSVESDVLKKLSLEELNEEIKDYQDTLARTEEQLRNLRKLANEVYMEGSE